MTPRNPLKELAELLEKAGARLLIGLESQGHIPTIERMLGEGATWDEIGNAIGWCPIAAKENYGWYLEAVNITEGNKND